jgi:outer membrane protein assembly factor BamE
MNRFLLTLCSAVLLAGCSWLAPHRLTVNQGNVLEQETLEQVAVGMTRNQVRFLLGTPLVTDPFHLERWDYIYSIQNGFNPRVQRRVTLRVQGELLASIEGDLDPAAAEALQAAHALDERAQVRRVQGEIGR